MSNGIIYLLVVNVFISIRVGFVMKKSLFLVLLMTVFSFKASNQVDIDDISLEMDSKEKSPSTIAVQDLDRIDGLAQGKKEVLGRKALIKSAQMRSAQNSGLKK